MLQEWTNKGFEKKTTTRERSWSEHTRRMATCDPRFAYNVVAWAHVAHSLCARVLGRDATGYI